MPTVAFTPHLGRFLDVPCRQVGGVTVRESLAQVFTRNPRLRGYILDDQGRLRRHVTIFVGGRPIADRTDLSDPVEPEAEIFVLQALSGG